MPSSPFPPPRELLTRLLHTTPLPTLLLQPLRIDSVEMADFHCLDASASAAADLGLTVGQLTGRPLSALFPDWPRQPWARRLQTALTDGNTCRLSGRHPLLTDRTGTYDVLIEPQADWLLLYYEPQPSLPPTDAERHLAQAMRTNALTGVAVYEAVLDETGALADFELRLFNQAAVAMTRERLTLREGLRLLETFSGSGTEDAETAVQAAFRLYSRVYTSGEPYHGETYHPFFKACFELSISRVERGLVVLAVDRTLRNQALAQNRQQAEFLEQLLATAQTALMFSEALPDETGRPVDFQVTRCNDKMLELTGFSREQMLTQTMLTLDPEGRQSGIFETYCRVFQTGDVVQLEHTFRGRWFQLALTRCGNGVLSSMFDITAIRESQQIRQQQAELLQRVVDTSPVGIALFTPRRDETGRITDFSYLLTNPANARLTGRSIDELLSHTMLTLFPGTRPIGYFDRMVAVMETGEPQQFLVNYTSEGIDAWIDTQFVRQGDNLLSTFQDVTTLKRAQLQLERANADLRRSNEGLQQFAYVASHDLQEPLRKLTTFGDVLARKHGDALGADGLDLIHRMQAAAGRMSTLIQDLLAYSRLAAPRLPAQPVDLTRVLRDVLRELNEQVTERRGTVVLEPLPTVSGDAGQLRQLFEHLLRNALTFCRPDVAPVVQLGSRLVSGRDLPDHLDTAEPGLNADVAFAEIWVADNGIGFDPKHADRIFQVFQRLHTGAQYAGTGVGLAIVRRVIDNHQGYISVQSRPGTGSTFRVYLPLMG